VNRSSDRYRKLAEMAQNWHGAAKHSKYKLLQSDKTLSWMMNNTH